MLRASRHDSTVHGPRPERTPDIKGPCPTPRRATRRTFLSQSVLPQERGETMAIHIQCTNPQCRKSLDCPGEHAGKTVRCPACGTALQVPATGQASGTPQMLGNDIGITIFRVAITLGLHPRVGLPIAYMGGIAFTSLTGKRRRPWQTTRGRTAPRLCRVPRVCSAPRCATNAGGAI